MSKKKENTVKAEQDQKVNESACDATDLASDLQAKNNILTSELEKAHEQVEYWQGQTDEALNKLSAAEERANKAEVSPKTSDEADEVEVSQPDSNQDGFQPGQVLSYDQVCALKGKQKTVPPVTKKVTK